jgi:hypothetical protein
MRLVCAVWQKHFINLAIFTTSSSTGLIILGVNSGDIIGNSLTVARVTTFCGASGTGNMDKDGLNVIPAGNYFNKGTSSGITVVINGKNRGY